MSNIKYGDKVTLSKEPNLIGIVVDIIDYGEYYGIEWNDSYGDVDYQYFAKIIKV